MIENIKEKYNLTLEEMEEIYRYVSYQYTFEDVLNVINTDYTVIKKDDIKRIAEVVAERMVYDGEDDANLSYWDNIHNFIEQEMI